MGRVRMYPREYVNGVVANHQKTQLELFKQATLLEARAELNLAMVRANPAKPPKVDPATGGPVGATYIYKTRGRGKYGHIDWAVHMIGSQPMALEFGHAASGKFAGGRDPHGRYIMSAAAGLGMNRYGGKRGRKISRRRQGSVYGGNKARRRNR